MLFLQAEAGNGCKMSHKIPTNVQTAWTSVGQRWSELLYIWVGFPTARRAWGSDLCLQVLTNPSHPWWSCVLPRSGGMHPLPPSHSLDRLVHLFSNNTFRWLKSSIFLGLMSRQIPNLGLHTQLQAGCLTSQPWTKINARTLGALRVGTDLQNGDSSGIKNKISIPTPLF